jgi:hypothetical protein
LGAESGVIEAYDHTGEVIGAETCEGVIDELFGGELWVLGVTDEIYGYLVGADVP